MKKIAFLAFFLLMARSASGVIVYQTVENPLSPHYAAFNRTFITQVTGNALIEYGDEILLSPNTPWQITNVRLGTQTFFEAGTLAYTPAFLEVKLYLNDGPLSFWL